MSHDLGVDLARVYEEKMKKNVAKYPVNKSRGNSAKYNQL
jgi:hypothetical protein